MKRRGPKGTIVFHDISSEMNHWTDDIPKPVPTNNFSREAQEKKNNSNNNNNNNNNNMYCTSTRTWLHPIRWHPSMTEQAANVRPAIKENGKPLPFFPSSNVGQSNPW